MIVELYGFGSPMTALRAQIFWEKGKLFNQLIKLGILSFGHVCVMRSNVFTRSVILNAPKKCALLPHEPMQAVHLNAMAAFIFFAVTTWAEIISTKIVNNY